MDFAIRLGIYPSCLEVSSTAFPPPHGIHGGYIQSVAEREVRKTAGFIGLFAIRRPPGGRLLISRLKVRFLPRSPSNLKRQ
jgi:hypothetical protein